MTRALFLPSAPYLLPFLKIRINSLGTSSVIPYKTLGITSQEILKNRPAYEAPARGLSAKGCRSKTKMASKNKREKAWTVSTTGAGNGHSPIIFSTGPRRQAFAFPAIVQKNLGTIMQPIATQSVIADANSLNRKNTRSARVARGKGPAGK